MSCLEALEAELPEIDAPEPVNKENRLSQFFDTTGSN